MVFRVISQFGCELRNFSVRTDSLFFITSLTACALGHCLRTMSKNYTTSVVSFGDITLKGEPALMEYYDAVSWEHMVVAALPEREKGTEFLVRIVKSDCKSFGRLCLFSKDNSYICNLDETAGTQLPEIKERWAALYKYEFKPKAKKQESDVESVRDLLVKLDKRMRFLEGMSEINKEMEAEEEKEQAKKPVKRKLSFDDAEKPPAAKRAKK